MLVTNLTWGGPKCDVIYCDKPKYVILIRSAKRTENFLLDWLTIQSSPTLIFGMLLETVQNALVDLCKKFKNSGDNITLAHLIDAVDTAIQAKNGRPGPTVVQQPRSI